MRAHEVTLTRRPPRRSYGCGAGSLEMITVSTWTRRDIGWVRVHGHYDVYCGYGNEHRIAVDEKVWAADYVGRDLDDVVHDVIGGVLDDEWFDPCEDAMSMPEPEDGPVMSHPLLHSAGRERSPR